jgi:hypothetical protein
MTLLKKRFDTTSGKPNVMNEARREASPRALPRLFASVTRLASVGCGRNRTRTRFRSAACHAALHRGAKETP